MKLNERNIWEVVRLMADISQNESFQNELKQGGLKIDWKAMFDVVAEGAVVADTPLDKLDTTDVPPVPENYRFLTATVTSCLAEDIAALQREANEFLVTSAVPKDVGSFLVKVLDVLARLELRTRPLLPVTIPYPPTAWPEPNPYYPKPYTSPTVPIPGWNGLPNMPNYPTITCQNKNGDADDPRVMWPRPSLSDATGTSEV